MYETALKVLKIIKDFGYEAYIIGGYPRNKYLNIKSDDIDICTSAPIDIIKANFTIIKDNSSYGSNVVAIDGYEYEITAYRRDLYEDTRYPTIIYVNTLKEDLMRRDFTINTLCIDYNGNYYNLEDVIGDLNDKIIRTVKNPEISINEDPLRILRAIRFSVDLNFKLEDELLEKIKEYSYLLKDLSKIKIKKEQEKVKNIDKYNKLLDILDLKKYLK